MKRILTILKKLFIAGFAAGFLLICTIAGCYMYVEKVSEGKTYSSVKEVPKNRVGVVLGTNPISRYSGKRNPYYYYRIDAVAALYKAGKIERVLISGDNRRKSYSEPDMMKADLVKAGIPASHICLDFAGFRTLDTIVRAKKVFGLNEFTIISQKFHNERAICLAEWQDLSVVGFNARDISARKGTKVRIREALARVKLALDMLTDKQPHFLGERIEIR